MKKKTDKVQHILLTDPATSERVSNYLTERRDNHEHRANAWYEEHKAEIENVISHLASKWADEIHIGLGPVQSSDEVKKRCLIRHYQDIRTWWVLFWNGTFKFGEYVGNDRSDKFYLGDIEGMAYNVLIGISVEGFGSLWNGADGPFIEERFADVVQGEYIYKTRLELPSVEFSIEKFEAMALEYLFGKKPDSVID